MTGTAPGPSRDLLHEDELVDYETHLGRLHEWAINVGKQPDTATGYAQGTVSRRISRIGKFYRWAWVDDGYTTAVTHDHADEYVQESAFSDQSENHKHNVVKATRMLFEWRSYEPGDDQ